MERTRTSDVMLRLLNNRRIIAPVILLMIGQILYTLPTLGDYSLEMLWREKGSRYLSFLLMGIGGAWIYIEFFSEWFSSKREDRFSDVDARRREQSEDLEIQKILDEIRDLKAGQQTVEYERLRNLVDSATSQRRQHRESQFESFEKYFDSLSSLLEEQAKVADEKASILLDKGTSYSRNGVLFFIFTIVVWQTLAALHGFQTQHIYGIASCSLLFIFIEFLSAWFLRQYRHYVDTSTYLLKVKSIFDRFMLSYLALSKSVIEEDTKKYGKLISLLAEDIKWPESYLLKNADISFAKEAVETMSLHAKTMKGEAKGKSDSTRSKDDS